MDLSSKHCVPCEGGIDPFTREQLAPYLPVVPEWTVSDDAKQIERTFRFKNFRQALDFVNKIGGLAESENHHPDLELSWGRVRVMLSTHAIHGLSENDFILAYKIDTIPA